MSGDETRSLFVCYIPGLDARRILPDVAPFLHELRREFSPVELRTFPLTELLPTMLTGVWPHQHRVWQVSLRPEFREPRRADLADHLPDLVSTTLQCAWHFFDPAYDLAAIPYRRRRRFRTHRFKYTRRQQSPETMAQFGDYMSIFGILGSNGRYLFTKDFGALPELAEQLPMGTMRLEFLEMYALDLTQHWHLDDAERMSDALRRTDAFVRTLSANCRRKGVDLMVLVDHGQERVVGTIPLLQALWRTGVPEEEFSYFLELASARFWFHTQGARARIQRALATLEHVSTHNWKEMHQYDVRFPDDEFGELYAFAEAGWVFFPHDYYQPIANSVLGLMDRHQRPRIGNPVHRGNHGYLPHYPSERGWMLLADRDAAAATLDATLIDVAPTILAWLDLPAPAHMTGRVLFPRAAALA